MKNTYKYDCHLHIHEGSDDSKISGRECIEKLIELGFSGCFITDHDTFDGYRYIETIKNNYPNFYIIKGIEYSTIDAGHILVFMPDEYSLLDIEHRGAKLEKLIKYVHEHGGILGPAHPCSEPYISIFSCSKYKNNHDILKQFDFIEILNGGEYKQENDKALLLATQYNLPTIAGSDAHYVEHIGKVCTSFNSPITCNNDFINYIKSNGVTSIMGQEYYNQDRIYHDRYKIFMYMHSRIVTILYSNKCTIK